MPAVPITVGELTNVPTFDSPIQSPWAQDVSHRVVHRFASIAARDAAYPAPAAGLGAICEVAGVLYVSNGTVWVDVARAAAQTVTGESRVFGQVTYGTNHDWIPAGSPAVEYSVPSVPAWATKVIIRCDLMAVFLAAGPAPVNATFFLLHSGPTGGPGGVTISGSVIGQFAATGSQRQSFSWSCQAGGTWTAGDKIQIGATVFAGCTFRFDPACTALFDLTWLP